MTVLALALILGSISVAFAADKLVRLTDIDGNANEEAIQVAYDLKIVEGTPEGTYLPENPVNRAEFAAMIARALAIPESALSSYSTTTFKDTAGYGWAVPDLAILQQRGIMKGDGYGNAMPGRTISPNEAVTMVLRAIGYTDNASVLVGQWPANYIALGQNLNLYAKVSNDLQINRASAAQMIYNVLTKQLVQVDANSTVSYLWDRIEGGTQNERTLLTTGLACHKDGPRVVTESDAAASKIDLIPRVGAYGVMYRSNADNKVVALTNVETEFLAGRFLFKSDGTIDAFESFDGSKYTVSSGSPKEGRPSPSSLAERFVTSSGISSSESLYTFKNGKNTSLSPTDIQKYVVEDPDGAGVGGVATKKVPVYLNIAAKVSGLTITDLRSVAVWAADDYFLYEAGQIDGKKFNGHNFPLDLNNEVDHYGYVLEGVNGIDELAADNVIYIYKHPDTKKITRIDVGTETQGGTVTNVNNADHSRTIGGKVLFLSPYEGLNRSDVNTPGNEGTALLDIYGRIYDFHLGEASKGNFAVVLAAGGDTFATSGTTKQYKLFDKTGAEVVYGKTNDFKYNDVNGTSITYGAPPEIGRAIGPVGELAEYKISGGKLSLIQLGTTISTPTSSKVNKAGTIITTEGYDRLIDSSVLVYVYNFKADGVTPDYTDISLGSIKDLLDGKLDKPYQYCVDDKGKVKALLVNSINAGTQNVFVMINSISDGWLSNGRVDEISGLNFADGASNAKYVRNYFDDGVRGATALNMASTDNGPYPTMAKFRIDENGVLKEAKNLRDLNISKGIRGTNEWIALGSVPLNAGQGGTFDLIATNSGIGGTYTVSPSEPYFTFESNAVLYKLEAGKWVAYRPTQGNFKDDNTKQDLYIFLKTDVEKNEKAYDVIIKVPENQY
jgi:hypothetical protein